MLKIQTCFDGCRNIFCIIHGKVRFYDNAAKCQQRISSEYRKSVVNLDLKIQAGLLRSHTLSIAWAGFAGPGMLPHVLMKASVNPGVQKAPGGNDRIYKSP